jgi:hypothetical protein
MAVQVRIGGIWRTISSTKVFANGAWRNLVAMQVYANGAWRVVGNFTPPSPPPPSGGGTGGGGGGGSMTLSISPVSQNVSSTTANVPAGVTATPSGGLLPITYSWSILTDEGGADFSIFGSTSASCVVRAFNMAIPDSTGCTVQCTATDSLGVSATSPVATIGFVTLRSGGGSGGGQQSGQ